MLLVQKCNLFLYLFSLKVSVEIIFNDFVKKNWKLFLTKKNEFIKVSKIAFF